MRTLEIQMVTKRRRAKALRRKMAIHSLIFLTKPRCASSGVYFTDF
jgi:hypothetical protein